MIPLLQTKTQHIREFLQVTPGSFPNFWGRSYTPRPPSPASFTRTVCKNGGERPSERMEEGTGERDKGGWRRLETSC